MIPEFHFYHGVALSKLVSHNQFTGLTRITNPGSAYAVNNAFGLHIKHSTKPKGPWQFTFTPDQQEEIRKLFQRFNEKTFIVLVCGKVGICLLKYGEYADTLQEDFRNQKVLMVSRRSGGGFRVSGSVRMKGVVPLNRYPGGLF
ncbi:MAG: hypothetical protein MUO91_01980 [candidate division Zixibacteria bacterium]|nr:hypothetical protein [candidate division Zixibacteria bacterium]